jgi:hypothetical protein
MPAHRPLVAEPGEGGVTRVDVPRAGRHTAWLRGSVRGEVELRAGGAEVGSARHELNHEGGFVRLGDVELPAGEAELRVELGGADLHPGSGGPAPDAGPLVLESAREAGPMERVDPEEARELCGRRWDWIEAIP